MAGVRSDTVCGETPLQLSCELLRNREQCRIVENRIPDFADQVKSLADRQVADLSNVFHVVILRQSFKGDRRATQVAIERSL
jgi:hypothetical protein